MKQVAITGSRGTIGTVLMRGLSGCLLTPIELPEIDVRDYGMLLDVITAHHVLVHLAWDSSETGLGDSGINAGNLVMISNVYRAALEASIPRVIMASSIHADSYRRWAGLGYMRPDKVPVPDSVYGATKVFMESLGRYYAERGLEVVCIRFGGINLADTPYLDEEDYEKVWLSHRDCVNLVQSCIDVLRIPGGFVVIYGVSDNKGRIHDVGNPFGWFPIDASLGSA